MFRRISMKGIQYNTVNVQLLHLHAEAASLLFFVLGEKYIEANICVIHVFSKSQRLINEN